MRRPTEMFWGAVAGRRPIPRAAASLGWASVNANPERGTVQIALDRVFLPLFTVPPADCDHGASAGWRLESTHQTSAGTVTYARCRCGAWLMLLDGRRLAAVHPRRRAATPPVPGERPRGRGRGWSWLRGHGQAVWKWTWRQRRRERADPR